MEEDIVLLIETPPQKGFTRVLTDGAEAVGKAGGLGPREDMRFQLAVEELFTYLALVADPVRRMRVVLTAVRHQVRAAFSVAAGGLDLGALNIHSAAALDEEGEPGQDLGLLLAARMADRFHIARDSEQAFTLQVEVDKAYPPREAVSAARTLSAPFTCRLCDDAALLGLSASLAASLYTVWYCPASFQTPAKFADLVLEGLVSAVVAQDAAGNPAGLFCWRPSGEKGIRFAGPFVFGSGGDMAPLAQALTDKFLETVGREGREIVFSERATPDIPPGYFEPLGRLTAVRPGETDQESVLYRHLREDAGAMVWAHPDMEPFLRRAYARLDMSREIVQAVRPAGRQEARSLFCVTADPGRNQAVLRPLMDGQDVTDNLARSVAVLLERGVTNVLVHLDLANAWEAALAADVAAAGFVLRLVLPHAGRSDVAVYQYAQPD